MAKIYRLSDKVRLVVDDLTITISPLSIHQKAAIEDAARGGTAKALMEASALAVKYALKSVDGLEDSKGKAYGLKFDDDGSLHEDTVNDLFNIEAIPKLTSICLALINNMPSEFLDLNGKKLEGVRFITEKEKKGKKNKAASGK